MITPITPLQRKAFFKLFAQACDVQGIPARQKEAYRHSLIEKAVPHSNGSLKAINSGAGFDRLMLLLAHEAHDADAAQKYVVAEGNRLSKMAEALARQVWQIQSGLRENVECGVWNVECGVMGGLRPHPSRPDGLSTTLRATPHSTFHTPHSINYIAAILKQAHFPHLPYLSTDGWWLDCTIDHLQKLIQMLDTHRRRLLRQWDAKLEWSPKLKTYIKMRVSFQLDAIYEWQGEILYKRSPEISHGVPTPRHPPIHIRAYNNEQLAIRN